MINTNKARELAQQLLQDSFGSLDSEAAALLLQLAEAHDRMARDAARFRWLREDVQTEWGEPWAITRYAAGDPRNSDDGTCPLHYEELDAAIDAAMGADQRGKE